MAQSNVRFLIICSASPIILLPQYSIKRKCGRIYKGCKTLLHSSFTVPYSIPIPQCEV